MIVAIDPGNVYSGFVIVTNDLKTVIKKDKVENSTLLIMLEEYHREYAFDYFVIEKIKSYGMAVGDTVFDTCIWIGRFYEWFMENVSTGDTPYFITRKQEASTICQSGKANDANIKQALQDRFAYGVSNHGKGTKKEPGYFYGFKADIWQAFAVAVTFHDLFLTR